MTMTARLYDRLLRDTRQIPPDRRETSLRRIGVLGTKPSARNFTSMALGEYLGLPMTQLRPMPNVLAQEAPRRTSGTWAATELISVAVARHAERAVQEGIRPDGFVSDGCSLQEWIHGRLQAGLGPEVLLDGSRESAGERASGQDALEDVMADLGGIFLRHVGQGFDAFLHLGGGPGLCPKGHPPVRRSLVEAADCELRGHLDALGLPVIEIEGPPCRRLEQAAEALRIEPVIPLEEAVRRAAARYQNSGADAPAPRRDPRASPIHEVEAGEWRRARPIPR